eukprot:TRINITY_DN5385_c0_g4_i1.p1 TRINITY_DN5385_c0_g4~~TRINITY_DN5385_c0_g4_i1.p1  ORF type:complete len:456 (-),score=57.11 TRINITY_DN5385_c0_g4_i1:283-1629(-)
MYAGYMTVDDAAGRALFYIFIHAEDNYETKPLTLWLNGGPGCSSVGGGFMSELGPYFPDKINGSTLVPNPLSWNRESNMIFLESPAGVGFSYSNHTKDYFTANDDNTADDNWEFLVQFFEMYPSFRAHDFYLAGESYAGHYIPQLAWKIHERNRWLAEKTQSERHRHYSINLKGFMIGNPWTDPDSDNRGMLFDWWSHGIISDATHSGIHRHCPTRKADTFVARNITKKCAAELAKLPIEMGNINIYNLGADVCVAPAGAAEMNRFSKEMLSQRLFPHSGLGYDPCIDNHVQFYLNQPEVIEALHARYPNYTALNVTSGWADCSSVLQYDFGSDISSVLSLYHKLLRTHLRILIYSGDTDANVPFTGTKRWLAKLRMNVVRPFYPWYTSAAQVGGWCVVYKKLTFATVRGAGHLVPYFKPGPALELFTHFLQNKPLPHDPRTPSLSSS